MVSAWCIIRYIGPNDLIELPLGLFDSLTALDWLYVHLTTLLISYDDEKLFPNLVLFSFSLPFLPAMREERVCHKFLKYA